jgi:HD-GYP domain-containing protein (c-di-GMP phosphodiesterase class II)
MEKNYLELVELGIALGAERNIKRLVERILIGAKKMANADGGTLYILDEDQQVLHFAMVHNDTLNIALGGTTGHDIPFPPLNLYSLETGAPNFSNVATTVALQGKGVNIEDAYVCTDFDFSGTKAFDAGTGYRSKSFLTLPLKNHDDRVIAVLQLINSLDENGAIVPFSEAIERMIGAMSSQAAVALDNQALLEGQRNLLEALIKMLASAIDAKSPYTGGHCQRVPELAKIMAQAAISQTEGAYADFNLNEEQLYEIHIAAWLHDCGKLTTPDSVMDKATKLHTIYDRIHEIRTRFEVLRRDAEIHMLRQQLAGADKAATEQAFQATVAQLEDDFAFVANCNIGDEFMADADVLRLQKIAEIPWVRYFDRTLGLSWEEKQRFHDMPPAPAPAIEKLLEDKPFMMAGSINQGELYNLRIQRGTLTMEERQIINDHIVMTQHMLDQLPFPRALKQVPEIAGNHHEKMDGSGYPKGLRGEDMSVPARIMAIADVFEALTARDRPYKEPKSLSQALKILSFMVKDNHLDKDLFVLFVRSGAFRDYGARFLHPDQLDDVDTEALLASIDA